MIMGMDISLFGHVGPQYDLYKMMSCSSSNLAIDKIYDDASNLSKVLFKMNILNSIIFVEEWIVTKRRNPLALNRH